LLAQVVLCFVLHRTKIPLVLTTKVAHFRRVYLSITAQLVPTECLLWRHLASECAVRSTIFFQKFPLGTGVYTPGVLGVRHTPVILIMAWHFLDRVIKEISQKR